MMKGDRELNTKRILGLAENERDNISWSKGINTLDKIIMALAYNSTPLKRNDFKELLELLASEKKVKKALAALVECKYLDLRTVYKESYISAGTRLIQCLDPDVDKPQKPYFGETAIDKYAIKSYLLKENLAAYLRNKINTVWDALGGAGQAQWLERCYIKNVVYTGFYTLDTKGRKTFLYPLGVLGPEEKKSLIEARGYSLKLEDLFVKSILKSWKGQRPPEAAIFSKNFYAAIKNDPLAVVRLWRGDLVSLEQMEAWTIEALSTGSIGGLKNHGDYIYDRLLAKMEGQANITEQMIQYDAFLGLQSYNALTTRRQLKSGNKEIIENHFELKGNLTASIEEMKKGSLISYSEDNRNSTCLTYQVLNSNDCLINQFKKSKGQLYLHFFVVVPGLELSKGAYKKKVDLITRFASLYELPYFVEFVSMSKGRSYDMEKRLNGILQSLGIGTYDMDGHCAATAWGHMYKFSTYREPRAKTDILEYLVSG